MHKTPKIKSAVLAPNKIILQQKTITINEKLIKSLLQPRLAAGHKGTFGHSLIVAGDTNTPGAAILTAMATLKSGCGLVTALVSGSSGSPLLCHLPEAMIKIRKSAADLTGLELAKYQAIVFGPGLGKSADKKKMLQHLLNQVSIPLVLDADGLNILSENKAWYKRLHANIVLTPHPLEFARLLGTRKPGKDLKEKQMQFARQYNVNIVLKGPDTTVATPWACYKNTTGNNGMATAGSGDVLAGIITSLCAQGYSAVNAAITGVFIHGFAGDVAAQKKSMHSMVATDIINGISAFFKQYETVS
ncbi:MAG: NAD(P)H-hydrate dehydratase [Ferruginibacter sp.]